MKVENLDDLIVSIVDDVSI